MDSDGDRATTPTFPAAGNRRGDGAQTDGKWASVCNRSGTKVSKRKMKGKEGVSHRWEESDRQHRTRAPRWPHWPRAGHGRCSLTHRRAPQRLPLSRVGEQSREVAAACLGATGVGNPHCGGGAESRKRGVILKAVPWPPIAGSRLDIYHHRLTLQLGAKGQVTGQFSPSSRVRVRVRVALQTAQGVACGNVAPSPSLRRASHVSPTSSAAAGRAGGCVGATPHPGPASRTRFPQEHKAAHSLRPPLSAPSTEAGAGEDRQGVTRQFSHGRCFTVPGPCHQVPHTLGPKQQKSGSRPGGWSLRCWPALLPLGASGVNLPSSSPPAGGGRHALACGHAPPALPVSLCVSASPLAGFGAHPDPGGSHCESLRHTAKTPLPDMVTHGFGG